MRIGEVLAAGDLELPGVPPRKKPGGHLTPKGSLGCSSEAAMRNAVGTSVCDSVRGKLWCSGVCPGFLTLHCVHLQQRTNIVVEYRNHLAASLPVGRLSHKLLQ
jgi:hypothetical protein